MCDTILAPPACTASGVTLFGKNSDRQRNEAQGVAYFPRAEYGDSQSVACTYLTIPQVSRTNAVVLCRPFWMWGAEMGANEHGVVIGNEGIHARSEPPTAAALTGMDLLRLALERASTADEAVAVITTLLECYGQGGNCGHLTASYYNNGFMIADATEAFVLETLGREWIVERIQDVRAISNAYSIGGGAHRVSTGLHQHLLNSGWTDEPDPDYAKVIADPNREHIGNAGARRACSTRLLTSRKGQLGALDMMNILRDHGSGDFGSAQWQPQCTVRRTICTHAGDRDCAAQTVGSLVSEIGATHAVHWVTATAAPCISIFKPLLLEASLPAHGPQPTDRFDPETIWWRHERLHRTVALSNLGEFMDDIRAERDALESCFHSRIVAVLAGDAVERARVVAECWHQAIAVEDSWLARVNPRGPRPHDACAAAWVEMNRIAGLEPSR